MRKPKPSSNSSPSGAECVNFLTFVFTIFAFIFGIFAFLFIHFIKFIASLGKEIHTAYQKVKKEQQEKI